VRSVTNSSQTGVPLATVKVAHNLPGLVPVRDSKAPHRPALILTALAWAPFIAALKTI
jgi:hypothetical protein